MQSVAKPYPLIAIVGPTAVGKTEISIKLAEHFIGEIVSADSRLFYRGMDVGTAKPSAEDQKRVPHHLIDVADPDQVWSLAKFQRAANKAIEEIHRRGKLPFLVGGTGQYIRAVVEGWQIPEVKPDLRLRQALQNWAEDLGAVGLFERLMIIDPEAAAKIEPSNLRRSVRALEVIFHTGEKFSRQKGRSGTPYQVLIIGINRPRSELYDRIDARIENMVANGLVEEVQDLLDKGYSPDLPPLSAIGYHQIINYLQGDITLEEGINQIKRSTRQFVRRQANWFKTGDPDVHWFQAGDNPIETMRNLIEKFLES